MIASTQACKEMFAAGCHDIDLECEPLAFAAWDRLVCLGQACVNAATDLEQCRLARALDGDCDFAVCQDAEDARVAECGEEG